MNRLKIIGMAVATLAVMLPGAHPAAAAPAEAAAPVGQTRVADPVILGSASCTVGTSFTCNTTAVQALGGTILLNVYANYGLECTYRVVDVSNGALVASRTFRGVTRPSIAGVYSWYKLELRNCYPGSWGYLEG